jgi:hypothetical protein
MIDCWKNLGHMISFIAMRSTNYQVHNCKCQITDEKFTLAKIKEYNRISNGLCCINVRKMKSAKIALLKWRMRLEKMKCWCLCLNSFWTMR